MKEEDIKELIGSQELKAPPSSLDDRIFQLLEESAGNTESRLSPAEQQESSPDPVPFPWNKAFYWAAAAVMVMSIFVAEMRKNNHPETLPENLVENEKAIERGSTVKKDFTVSSSAQSNDVFAGRLITMPDGRILRPVIRQHNVKKIYIDKATNVKIEVNEPSSQILYIEVKSD